MALGTGHSSLLHEIYLCLFLGLSASHCYWADAASQSHFVLARHDNPVLEPAYVTVAQYHRFMRVLPRRLEKYGLRLNEHKTHLLVCGKRYARYCFQTGQRPPTFDFLGLTHYWGHSRKGYVRLKRKTSKHRLRRALVELNKWLRQHRSTYRLPLIWKVVGQKLRGHFNYFGVTDNSRAVSNFEQKAHDLLFKWLNRRSQRRSFTWTGFLRYRTKYPLPRPGRVVSLYPS